MEYFEKLNYTLANEDTRVEQELLSPEAAQIFSIAGSGARVLPLLAKNPKRLTVVDVSAEQLFLCELRVAAARTLSHPEFLFFLGYRGATYGGPETGDDRRALLDRLSLSHECAAFWKSHSDVWAPRGFILLGKWENHFQKLGSLFRKGLRMNIAPIFEAQSLEEQAELYRKLWRPTLFRSFLRVAASETVFNRFLYKGSFSGASDRSTEKRAPWKFLDDEFRRLFTSTLVRRNYFLQILFLGAIRYEEGLPLEAQPETLASIQTAKTSVRYLHKDLVTALPEAPYEFFSLSDTISYLKDSDASSLLAKLHPDTPSGARVVIRSFLRSPRSIQTQGWKRENRLADDAFRLDGTGVYRFHIFSKL